VGEQLGENHRNRSIQSSNSKRHKQTSNKSKKFINSEFEDNKELYKDSVDILGVSLDELEEFMNPDKLTRNDVSSVDRILLKFK
jgi:hypothetical protein